MAWTPGACCSWGSCGRPGGRVLNLVTVAPDLGQARARVEQALPTVTWPGMQSRKDIGLRALKHALAGRTVRDAFE